MYLQHKKQIIFDTKLIGIKELLTDSPPFFRQVLANQFNSLSTTDDRFGFTLPIPIHASSWGKPIGLRLNIT